MFGYDKMRQAELFSQILNSPNPNHFQISSMLYSLAVVKRSVCDYI